MAWNVLQLCTASIFNNYDRATAEGEQKLCILVVLLLPKYILPSGMDTQVDKRLTGLFFFAFARVLTRVENSEDIENMNYPCDFWFCCSFDVHFFLYDK